MTLHDIIIEKSFDVYEAHLETNQHLLEQMVMETYKEWEYLNCCINYHKEPTMDAVYQEAKIGRGIRNLVTRFRALTHRNLVVIRTLLGHVKDMSQGFFSRFHKSGAKKSVSAIANENLRKKLDPDKKLAESEARVKVPYTGNVKQDEIVLINSALLIKEFNDDDTFEVDLIGVNYLKDDKGKRNVISDKGEGVKSLASVVVYTNALIYFVKHKGELDELCELIVEGFEIANHEDNVDPMEYSKKVTKLMHKANSKMNGIDGTGIKMSMKELTAFQARMNKLEQQLDFAQNGNNRLNDVDTHVISALNDLVSITENIQFGLTSLSNAMQKVHLIDLKYMNSIDDRNVLSKFVYDCIQNGIPPKYIAYNTWLIANESIRGSASKYKPVGGQTRCVFFPNDNKKEILKIAISGIGIVSNKNEIRFSEFMKNYKEQEMLDISALVTNTYAEDAILSMERVVDKVGKHPDPIVLNEIKQKYVDFAARHPELRLVVTDFNDGNVMWSSDKNRWVCIDYGLGKRDSRKQDRVNQKAERALSKYEEKSKKSEK